MYIIFDTNIWISQLGLNSSSGAAVRFYVRQCGATVVIPEVVRLETEKNLTNQLLELRNSIEKNHRQLLAVFGTLKELVLPSEKNIRDKVSEIFTNIDLPSLDVPLSLSAATSSLLKVIEGLPPSECQQQFKDGVIWANCLELLERADVYFVSDDKDFYEKRNYEYGLASNLSHEAEAYAHNVKLIRNLRELLEDIRQDIQINKDVLAASVFDEAGEYIRSMLQQTGFALGKLPHVEVELFATEITTQLYVEFAISYRCEDATNQGRVNATLEFRGDGLYNTQTQKFHGINNSGEKFQYTDMEGQKQTKSNILLRGTAVLGHKDVVHAVRSPLSE